MTSVVAKERVADLRADIDSIDDEIQRLLIRRREVSQTIREAKEGTGLPDTDLGREMVVLTRYRSNLGRAHGNNIGHSILEYSKDRL